MQVQLANKYDTRRAFEKGLYSRKFDGKRMYYLDGVAYSRDNKVCRPHPILHITEKIVTCEGLQNYVVDGEVIYFEPGFAEDFKKAISMTSRIQRSEECINLCYVIFDLIDQAAFMNEEAGAPFIEQYEKLKEILEAEEIPGRCDLLKTKLPGIYIARQTPDLFEMVDSKQYQHWEGLMYREGAAPYEYKRSNKLLKIKSWNDTYCKVIGVKEGLGKYQGNLGALLVNYKGSVVAVGSGFTDQERTTLWEQLTQTTDSPLAIAMRRGELEMKVKYFEESCDADGEVSLRFPTYLCFKDNNGDFSI